jgi:thiamine biosynthesis protein ThiS
MTIFLNGEPTECEVNATVERLLTEHGLPLETTLVEHNGIALRRRDWATQRVTENDRIEILRVAAGG